MSRCWTEEQLSAICTSGCDLLVAAAAGSGKTAVLVERVIRKVTDSASPIDIDSLLVVTFTNAAAHEMRTRVAEALSKKLAENPLDSHLLRQLTLLNNASITTIHSFCLNVVRQNFNALGIDPSFRIADQTELLLVKSELLSTLFEELYSQCDNDWFLSFIECYGENTGDLRAQELVLRTYTFIQSNPQPIQWLKDAVARFDFSDYSSSDDAFSSSAWLAVHRSFIELELAGALAAARQAIDIINSPGGPYHFLDALQSDMLLIEFLLSKIDCSFDELFEAMDSAVLVDLSRKRPKDIDDVKKDAVKKIRDTDIKKVLFSLKQRLFFKQPIDMLSDLKKVAPAMNSLLRIVTLFDELFSAYKRDNMIVDFNDLEHFCLSLLYLDDGITPSSVADTLSLKYSEILIDEYQDSNSVQELILLAISRKRFGTPNRFMVGDVKQSIYRFRQSDPGLFMDKYNCYSLSDSGLERRIDLFKNFRSRSSILTGVNFLFSQLMTNTVGEIVYDESAALNPAAIFPDNADCDSVSEHIEICLLDKDGDSSSDDNSFDNSSSDELSSDDLKFLSNIEFEARIVAMRIQRLIASKQKILDASGEYRTILYSDIVILLRTVSGWDFIFTTELAKFDIPAFANTSTGFFKSIEVMTIVSLLQIVDNPRQDIPLIAVLRSPIFSFDTDELVLIRSSVDRGPFFDALYKFIEDNEDDLLSDKILAFLRKLDRWRDVSVHMPIDEFLWLLYEETNFLALVGVMPGGEIRQANLRGLLERASQYENSCFNGIFNFILFIEKLRNSNSDISESKVLSENENVVKIMSIHKSKGLEFPVVIVSGLGKQFNLMDCRASVLFHPKLGLGPEFIDANLRVRYNTIPRMALSLKITQENLSEELRILYVAFTRAKEKLILTGLVKNIDKKAGAWCKFNNMQSLQLPPYYMLGARCPLDWIMPAVARHEDGLIIRDVAGVTHDDLLSDSSHFDVSISTVKDMVLNEKNDIDKEKLVIDELKSWDSSVEYGENRSLIIQKLNWKYKFSDCIDIPANVSISEIKRRFQSELLNEHNTPVLPKINLQPKQLFVKPDFFNVSLKLSAAEIGTAFHTVMQHLDLRIEPNFNELVALLDSLVQKDIITVQQRACINVDSIFNFTKSEIATRIRNSKIICKEAPFVLGISPGEAYFNSDCDETILVHGIIDVFFEEDDQFVILDYKTDYVVKGTEEELKNKYFVQLDIYKKALERITGKKVKETNLYLFSSCTCLVV